MKASSFSRQIAHRVDQWAAAKNMLLKDLCYLISADDDVMQVDCSSSRARSWLTRCAASLVAARLLWAPATTSTSVCVFTIDFTITILHSASRNH